VKSGLENRDYGRRGSAALTMRHPLYPQKLALTSPTSGGRSVGIVRSRTKDTKLFSYNGKCPPVLSNQFLAISFSVAISYRIYRCFLKYEVGPLWLETN
jgi:hypothetical protein